MKKLLWVLVAAVCISPSFAEDKKDEHAGSEKKAVESVEKKAGTERASKEAAGKGELSKKVDACLSQRPEAASK